MNLTQKVKSVSNKDIAAKINPSFPTPTFEDNLEAAKKRTRVDYELTDKEKYDRSWARGKNKGQNTMLEKIRKILKDNSDKKGAELLEMLPKTYDFSADKTKKKIASVEAQLAKLKADYAEKIKKQS